MKENNFVGMAFGAALTVAAVVCLAIAVADPLAGFDLYARFAPIFAVITFGVVLSVPHVPALWASAWWHLAEAEHLRLQAAQHAYDRRNVGKVKLTLTAQLLPAVDARAEAWRRWTVRHLEAIRDGTESGPHYTGGLDAAMDFPLWKIFTYILMKLELIGPVVNRQRTVFVAGVNAQSAALAVRAAKVVPLPPEVTFDPPGSTEQPKYAENSTPVMETGE